MLNWIAGQKATDALNGEFKLQTTRAKAHVTDRKTDPDATGYVEPPETPAPVFAIRAFKHAIFGTPQPPHTKSRRHSNTENGRPKTAEPKPVRPVMNRPKSTSDALPIAKPEIQPLDETLASPTKGILLTPGAAAARKKNVTFGDGVLDNEGKRPMKNGLPEDCPGKDPSPWNTASEESQQRDESPDKGRGRNKLTEAFEQVRDESRKRKSKDGKTAQTPDEDDNDLNGDDTEPQSRDGKYWKREYDLYRTNTQREVKKLITKQKAAKSFALMKDTQCTDLADQLREEQKKAQALEAKTQELASLVKDLQNRLRSTREAGPRPEDRTQSLTSRVTRKDRTGLGGLRNLTDALVEKPGSERPVDNERAKSKEFTIQHTAEGTTNLERPVNERKDGLDDPVQRPSEPFDPPTRSEATRPAARNDESQAKTQPEDVQLKPDDDIWAQLDSFSNPVIAQPRERAPPASSRPIATGAAEGNPLKALSINTLSNGSRRTSRGSPQSADVEHKSAPDLGRRDSKNSPPRGDHEKDSSLFSPALPGPSSELHSAHLPEKTDRPKQDAGIEVRQDSFPSDVSVSNPRQVERKPLPPIPTEGKIPPSTDTKENISPISKSQQQIVSKPSAMWSSMNAPPAGKRNTSVTARDGKELSQDRIEAARARIAARGRVTS